MSEYIIRNCPCYEFGFCTSYYVRVRGCQDCTGCIMKRIVGLCKENLNSLETYIDARSFERVILQNILKLLDIQEVE